MITFGNLRPMNSANDKLLLYYDPNEPNHVGVQTAPEGATTALWNGDGQPPGNIYLIHSGQMEQGTLLLTMSDDKPNSPVYMEKWLSTNSDPDPRQVWIPGYWEGQERTFVTLKGNILQASKINEASTVIVGDYPENNAHDRKPKTPGQIWLSSSKSR